jgi:uncharacterized membrane protein
MKKREIFMIKNKILTSLLGVFVVLLLITFSIGLPIYFRPFYYMQIDSLELEMETGLTKEEIIDGYNEVLDFLTVGQRVTKIRLSTAMRHPNPHVLRSWKPR